MNTSIESSFQALSKVFWVRSYRTAIPVKIDSGRIPEAFTWLAMNGAQIPPSRPTVDAKPTMELRADVGNSSAVYEKTVAKTMALKPLPTSEKPMRSCQLSEHFQTFANQILCKLGSMHTWRNESGDQTGHSAEEQSAAECRPPTHFVHEQNSGRVWRQFHQSDGFIFVQIF